MVPARDAELVQIVDAALADATSRGKAWLACRPGCTPCCHGVFRISPLDAERLQAGLAGLELADPARAGGVSQRARAAVRSLASFFPGDAVTGLLAAGEESGWEEFADLPVADEACPVLDPETGRCDLYASRPLTCRIFGPPVASDGGLGVCELCYVGATESELLAGEMHLSHHALEAELDAELESAPGCVGETIIAWALAGETRPQAVLGSIPPACVPLQVKQPGGRE